MFLTAVMNLVVLCFCPGARQQSILPLGLLSHQTCFHPLRATRGRFCSQHTVPTLLLSSGMSTDLMRNLLCWKVKLIPQTAFLGVPLTFLCQLVELSRETAAELASHVSAAKAPGPQTCISPSNSPWTLPALWHWADIEYHH